jgi:hypothetical protein
MTLKQDLQYSPTDCFETFPFPLKAWDLEDRELSKIGLNYHEYRGTLMLSLWLGLTELYNLLHSEEVVGDLNKHFEKRAKKDPQGLQIPEEHRAAALAFTYEEALAGIIELRRLHVEMDSAVLAAYGWHEDGEDGPAIDLVHNFYDVETLPENDRTRYTISTEARKEVLKRLLALNHRRAAEEAASAPAKPKGAKRSKKSKDSDGNDSTTPTLFD